jgi:protocatechuate 3,4-dioxygenase beta subunit
VALLPILAHELAHLQHHDLHTLAATRLLLALLWPQPLYWLLRRTIRLDQETLADAAAADRAGRLDYAQQLLAWASSAGAQYTPRLAGAVGLWEGPSQLKRRIAVLLNERFEVMRTCSRRWRWLSVSCVAVVVAALSLVTLQPVTDAAEDDAAGSTTPSPEVVMARKNELLRGIVRAKNSVRGYCVDEHGKPLAGAKISLFDYRSSDHAGRPRVFRETLSDERGYFSIDAAIDVEKAKLDGIPVDKPFDQANGWAPITINAHAPGRAARYDHIPTVLLVQDGDLRMFELRPAKSLSGKVTDAAGRPVAGVQVTAAGYVLSSDLTDANGEYEIRDLFPMDGTPGHQLTPVEFRHPDFALQKAGPATVPGKLDVTLQPGGDIEGRVEIQDGATNRPAAHVDVMVALFTPYTPGQSPPPNVPGAQYSRTIDRELVRTNDNGEYRIQSLAPADYGATVIQNELVTNGVTPIKVKPKETTTAPPIVLTRGVRIRVKLIDAETKQPIPFDKQTRGVVNPILGSPTVPSMQTRREFKPYGDFGEVNVAPGAYSLFVTNRNERLESVDDRLPSGDRPAYHEFQAEEGKDLEFVVPMRVSSSNFVDPWDPAIPGVVIEGSAD